MPADLLDAGACFNVSDRRDNRALGQLLAAGADLLVDRVCFTAVDARQLLPHLPHVGSAVILSSKAVYIDASGHHVNSDIAPRFDAPITESQATMKPGDGNYESPEGYGVNEVAAEQVLLDSGLPVTVTRPSKVHGEGASRPGNGCSSSGCSTSGRLSS